MRTLLVLPLLFTAIYCNSQTAWTWEELDSLPERVSNNAVTFGKDETNDYVFSFGGIDSTKIHSGINKRAYRYTISTNNWEEIAPLPFALSNIASAASTVKNTIYIFGGYHVNPGGGEISSNEVIRYSPITNSYLTNGTAIPIPIDDHIQCVWQDSLIFLITGWSNTGNVPNVQIYDAELDSWQVGTATPNTNDYKAFGASGEIIGDTIYYYGGASTGVNFPARKILRKGVINAENPTEITWTILEEGPNTLYRSAALHYENNMFWLGGSATSYNYNGIAYNGTGGVNPLTQIMRYDQTNAYWYAGEGAPYGVMDLRGIAQINATQWIVCGGMETDQFVSRKSFLLTYDPLVGGIKNENTTENKIVIIDRDIRINGLPNEILLLNANGQIVANIAIENPKIPSHFTGFYIVQIKMNNAIITEKIILD